MKLFEEKNETDDNFVKELEGVLSEALFL